MSPRTFLVSHDLAVCAEAALAAADSAWFLDLAQGAVMDLRYQMGLSALMGLSVAVGEEIGRRRDQGDTYASVEEVNEIRRQAAEEERTSHGAPPRLEMGTMHGRLYRAAFAAARHRHCRDTLTAWQTKPTDRSFTEAAAVVALVGIYSPAPMTNIRLRAVTMELGYRASATRRAEQYGLIGIDVEGLYRVTPELADLIPWSPPAASDG